MSGKYLYKKFQGNPLFWEETDLEPFDELIISWCAKRPQTGAYTIFISVLERKWSAWQPYMHWEKDHQHSYALDTIEVQGAIGFRVRVEAPQDIEMSLYAAMARDHKLVLDEGKFPAYALPLQGFSQLCLNDPQQHRMCSPSSVAAVLRYLGCKCAPLALANKVFDHRFAIYGNWVLNAAEAAAKLYGQYDVFVVRLTSFVQVVESLERKCPVIVSVKGPLPGSALSYEEGHLLVIRGYDPLEKKVLCVDPAFPRDDLTLVGYDLADFLTAWGRRKGLAYMFYEVSL